jgi:hypothetical protein
MRTERSVGPFGSDTAGAPPATGYVAAVEGLGARGAGDGVTIGAGEAGSVTTGAVAGTSSITGAAGAGLSVPAGIKTEVNEVIAEARAENAPGVFLAIAKDPQMPIPIIATKPATPAMRVRALISWARGAFISIIVT